MRRRLGDRRTRPRFEVVGDLWGSVEAVLRLPVRDVGLAGALLESHATLPVDSVHRIIWDTREDTSTHIRVRHVRPVVGADGEQTYLIGVEFLGINPRLAYQIQQWMSQVAGDPPLQEA